MCDSLVIIPTYNEIENIETAIRRVFTLPVDFDILVVDDQSPDGTANKVVQLQEEFGARLQLLLRQKKMGLGLAYVDGFKHALAANYQFIFEMDADLSHNPADLIKLKEACLAGHDMAIGSRYVRGVNVVNWPLSRVLLSYFASRYVKVLTGMKIHDATAGFVCFRRKVLEQINVNKIRYVGYAFQIEMKYRTYCSGFSIVEVPIIFTDRTKGQSKMSNSIIKEAVFAVMQLRWLKIINRL